MKNNRLWIIGFLGGFDCYLNVSRDEAIARYKTKHGYDEYNLSYLDFEDEFEAYDISDAVRVPSETKCF